MSLGRTTIRGILVGIIGMTMLCYVCAFAFWASSPEQNQPQRTNTPIDPFGRATNTPLDPFVIATLTAAANSSGATATLPFEQPTTLPGITPIVPTFQTFPTITPLPTFTLIPTNTVPPTQPPTAIPPTAFPTEAPPIILPPTDTPTSP
jgi:hypothetical protein